MLEQCPTMLEWEGFALGTGYVLVPQVGIFLLRHEPTSKYSMNQQVNIA
jgi:hypothetical protein